MKRTSASLGRNPSATSPRRQRTLVDTPPRMSQNDASASSDHEHAGVTLNAVRLGDPASFRESIRLFGLLILFT